VRCIDATGAGDAFLAGAIAVLAAAGARVGNAAWKDAKVWTRALELGHIMGAKAVSGVGAISGLTGLESAKAKVELARKG
jgi:sugar/nucleoside kinase (ribokinase family)